MLLPLKVDRDKPLQQQLHDQVRDLIETGALPSGQRMPSTRALAEHYAISRMTVLLTYERLIAAGLLHTTPSGGTFVGFALRAARVARPGPVEPAVRQAAESEGQTGQPDPALFPAARWRALLRAAAGRFAQCGAPMRPADRPGLQATLAKWLRGARGLDVAPEQVLVLPTRQQALEIVAHMLLRPGRLVACESPGDGVAASLWAARGARLVPLPVDGDGLTTERLPPEPGALAYVTPGYQYPLGVKLAAGRRRDILDWAHACGGYVIEGDRIGDLRYDHDRPQALMGEDAAERVLHIGDFAGVLGPWLAAAYLVVPRHLAAPAQAAMQLFNGRNGSIELSALAEFIESGAYVRHLLRLRKVYLGRRDTLIRCLRQHFGEDCRIGGATAGLSLTWSPAAHTGQVGPLADLADRCGLDAARVGDRVVLLGFGSLAEPQLEARVGRLAAALAEAGAAHLPTMSAA